MSRKGTNRKHASIGYGSPDVFGKKKRFSKKDRMFSAGNVTFTQLTSHAERKRRHLLQSYLKRDIRYLARPPFTSVLR